MVDLEVCIVQHYKCNNHVFCLTCFFLIINLGVIGLLIRKQKIKIKLKKTKVDLTIKTEKATEKDCVCDFCSKKNKNDKFGC